MSRLAAGAVLAFALACGGSDWLTGPGAPLELSHQSLEGQWVLTLAVLTKVDDPSVERRTRLTTETGSILEFDGAGGVDHSRLAPGGGNNLPTEYTISGDTLTLSFSYQAEVSTTRLVLTLRGITHDFDEDDSREDAVNVTTYQRARN